MMPAEMTQSHERLQKRLLEILWNHLKLCVDYKTYHSCVFFGQSKRSLLLSMETRSVNILHVTCGSQNVKIPPNWPKTIFLKKVFETEPFERVTPVHKFFSGQNCYTYISSQLRGSSVKVSCRPHMQTGGRKSNQNEQKLTTIDHGNTFAPRNLSKHFQIRYFFGEQEKQLIQSLLAKYLLFTYFYLLDIVQFNSGFKNSQFWGSPILTPTTPNLYTVLASKLKLIKLSVASTPHRLSQLTQLIDYKYQSENCSEQDIRHKVRIQLQIFYALISQCRVYFTECSHNIL